MLKWLLDPVLQDDEHFKQYADVKDTETIDEDRLSYKVGKTGTNTYMRGATAVVEPPVLDLPAVEQEPPKSTAEPSALFTSLHARYTAECVECRKPRVIYCKSKLTDRLATSLAILLSGSDYTCGTYSTAPGDSLQGKVHVRLGLTCQTPTELPYYSSQHNTGRKDLCCHYAAPNTETEKKI